VGGEATGVGIREYTDEDLEACLAVFDSNVPTYFRIEERTDFEGYLRELPGPYLVAVDARGDVVACGGHARRDDPPGVADRCWGMARRDLHGRGIGRRLTLRRLDAARRDPRVEEVALNTSQRTTGFYERLGFRTVEVERDGYAPGLDRCEMRLSVDGASDSERAGEVLARRGKRAQDPGSTESTRDRGGGRG